MFQKFNILTPNWTGHIFLGEKIFIWSKVTHSHNISLELWPPSDVFKLNFFLFKDFRAVLYMDNWLNGWTPFGLRTHSAHFLSKLSNETGLNRRKENKSHCLPWIKSFMFCTIIEIFNAVFMCLQTVRSTEVRLYLSTVLHRLHPDLIFWSHAFVPANCPV